MPHTYREAGFGDALDAHIFEGKEHRFFLGKFRKLALSDIFAFFSSKRVINVTRFTSEAFALSGIIGGKDG